ncbi:hypothetical protein [Methylobrevis pamukkalensis]|uniref:Clp protease n=1 Tax=Methylobrevis pamukkalensis TaxID=1439726 RepID=A0A1E3H2Z1_9HYPH|nr:hypothetical protein [Methylobrevis pamukkalensis]ODN70688.1 hypothetical protein A6302_01973 [Methylobrevis pamukkalensis]
MSGAADDRPEAKPVLRSDPRPAAHAVPLWRRILGPRPDERVLRTVFYGLASITVTVLCLDLAEQMAKPPPTLPARSSETLPAADPNLPSARPDVAPAPGREGPKPMAELGEPMSFELVAGGRLEARGTITPGTAARFAEEIGKRGGYATTIVLDSPGGSVTDALEMSRLIRARGLDTLVEEEGRCASSCPLVFSGGTQRFAEEGASVGVHQVSAMRVTGGPEETGAEGMASAQRVSAECQRHLVDMGVDPRVWIHAMETPPEQIFYFTQDELLELKLATSGNAPVTTAAAQ